MTDMDKLLDAVFRKVIWNDAWYQERDKACRKN